MNDKTTDTSNNKRYRIIQRWIFILSLCACCVFVIVFLASEFRNLLGFNPQWAGDNFAFNLVIVFPTTVVCFIVFFYTGWLTLFYWKRLPKMKKKIFSLLVSYSFILYLIINFVIVLRMH